jgi:PII-like signaling protein
LIPEDCTLLRVFVGETDRHDGKPLYEAIVYQARELDLAGATVLRGVLGFGADSRMHAAKILALSDDLPTVVEIVDTEANIGKILPFLDDAVEEGWLPSSL